jgi:uncharacterized cupin superfamily protein
MSRCQGLPKRRSAANRLFPVNRARAEWLVKSHDRTVSFVIWDCTRGIFRWDYNQDETFVVTAGEAFITDEGEREYRLGPGDMAYCPAGSSCTWRVPDYVKKIAVLRSHLPMPVSFLVRVWHRLMRVVRRMGSNRVSSTMSTMSANPPGSPVSGPFAESEGVTSTDVKRTLVNGVSAPEPIWRVAPHRTPSTETAPLRDQSGVANNQHTPGPEPAEISVGCKP